MISSPNRDDLVFPKVTSFSLLNYWFNVCKHNNNYQMIYDLLALAQIVVIFVYLCFLLYQGGWEDDETVEEAACREALEEAGVKGIIKVSLHLCLCYSGPY